MKWFQDIFTKSKLMIISGIIAFLGWTAYFINSAFIHPFGTFYEYFILAVMLLMLLIFYKKGETSAQKALSASILAVSFAFYWFQVCGLVWPYDGTVSTILEIAMTIITGILFLNHIILQTDHSGDLKIITVNEIMLVLVVLIQIVQLIAKYFCGGSFYDIYNSFCFLFTYLFIVCIEARIQKYKSRRFIAMKEGTWTEEERQKCKKIFKF